MLFPRIPAFGHLECCVKKWVIDLLMDSYMLLLISIINLLKISTPKPTKMIDCISYRLSKEGVSN